MPGLNLFYKFREKKSKNSLSFSKQHWGVSNSTDIMTPSYTICCKILLINHLFSKVTDKDDENGRNNSIPDYKFCQAINVGTHMTQTLNNSFELLNNFH